MLALGMQIAVWGLAAVLAVGTLIPLSPSRLWWVRIWDFPRLHVAGGFALLLPLSLLLGGWAAFAVGALGLAGVVYQMSWIFPYTPFARREVQFAPEAPDAVTLLAANVLMENVRFDLMRALIDKVDPDVLLLMETDARWTAEMEPVLARYHTVLREPRDDHYGMIFATRLEAKEAKIVHLTHDTTPTALAELTTRAGRDFIFVGLHPQPPVPDGDDTNERDAQIIYAARFARRTDTPLVAMGDFNEAAWSEGAKQFKRVGGYVDPRAGRGMYASFDARHFMIRCPIDQIYVTGEVAVVAIDLGPKVGSDHFPLTARVRIEPELGRRLNTPPPPLDPTEITRLDEIAGAYRSRLDAAAARALAAQAEAE